MRDSRAVKLQRTKLQLAHSSPHYGSGLRRQQSKDGSWREGQLERGKRCNEISHQYRTRAEGDEAAGCELGIQPRQVRTYRKFWAQRLFLRQMWQHLPTNCLPTTMEQALHAIEAMDI